MEATSNTDRCPYCGEKLEEFVCQIGGHWFSTPIPCRCELARADRMARMCRDARDGDGSKEAAERLERRMRRAGIPKRFWNVQPIGGWRDGAYIVGNVGVGKSHMAAQMALGAMDEGATVRFMAGGEFLRRLRDSFDGEGTEGGIIRSLSTCDLLILDDLGKDKPTDWAVSMLYQLVDARYNEDRPIVVTSQYERDQLLERFALGERDTAEAIVSRLFEMCPRVRLDGKDRRLG